MQGVIRELDPSPPMGSAFNRGVPRRDRRRLQGFEGSAIRRFDLANACSEVGDESLSREQRLVEVACHRRMYAHQITIIFCIREVDRR